MVVPKGPGGHYERAIDLLNLIGKSDAIPMTQLLYAATKQLARTARSKKFLGLAGLHVVGDVKRPIKSVAIACGSDGELLENAIRAGCD